ncbi:MAG: indolepyruvate ferredoxin oxidoreductase family protein, partial [Bdellovibrionota bacterium]
KAFAAAHEINRIALSTENDWLGIVAAGKTYYDLRQALWDLGLDDAALQRYGVRLLQMRMLFPMETGLVREFAAGLEEILVVEEKRGFLELLLRDALYGSAVTPRIVGKRDEAGAPFVPASGELDPDRIARLVAARLGRRVQNDPLASRLALLDEIDRRRVPEFPSRQPYFCSGCPHNRSTVVPEGSIAGGGIGCHFMALTMDRDTFGVTQMGGEGAQWTGMAPFTETPHFFQNIGDGTLFHSGSLAIRQAVAAKVNLTFKILYNSAVAMTGGQAAAGALSVPDLTRELAAEGVRKILVVSEDPGAYPRSSRWGEGVEIWHRDRLEEAQKFLRGVPGVTVLLYDQRCAAEKRRLRGRKELADPTTRVFINEAVCEGCGDCGEKSNCLSVHPVETEFGRKTQIHQSSCNKDYSCLLGDCPSFLTVVPKENGMKRPWLDELPARSFVEPQLPEKSEWNIFLVGIGGTGVVTVNRILGAAAFLEGKRVLGLDQTGLSQKGGPVVSHLRILEDSRDAATGVPTGGADCYLGFDVLGAASAVNLSRAVSDRAVAVVSTGHTPTGAMVASPEVHFPETSLLRDAIDSWTRGKENFYFDAQDIAEAATGDHLSTNLIVLGAAYQRGIIPVHAASIERAIGLNAVAVPLNLAAFRLGRLAVSDPAWLAKIPRYRPGAVSPSPPTPQAQALVQGMEVTGELRRLLEIRISELTEYQNAAYAREYAGFVQKVAAAERAAVPGNTFLSEAVARHLFQLMAYKDEYEVARLHLKEDVPRALAAQFPAGVRVRYHLHPPFLRAMGLKHKIAVGSWIRPFFRLLFALRRLRGTWLDFFGRTLVRRTECALPGEYRALIEKALEDLCPETYGRAVRLARLPGLIRGYEDVKLRGVGRFRAEARALGF